MHTQLMFSQLVHAARALYARALSARDLLPAVGRLDAMLRNG
jgi:hypothetical protein